MPAFQYKLIQPYDWNFYIDNSIGFMSLNGNELEWLASNQRCRGQHNVDRVMTENDG